MHRHEPDGYVCPLCRLVAGEETERNRLDDVVLDDEDVLAFVSPKWWPNNPGHVIVISKAHVENLYDMPTELLASVYGAAREIAIALRAAYGCEGTSTRQHNEPAGNQDVWHFHVHVFPRWAGDDLYLSHGRSRWPEPAERTPYAEKLRAVLSAWHAE
jgi:histidine triad (HIT) family protein